MSELVAALGNNPFVIDFLAPIFLIGFIIFIHESGHFLLAKLFGVGVEQFAFGFGPRLFGFQRGMTDYRVNLIPLGGYVKMVGDDPFSDENDEPRPDGFLAQAPWKRLMIVGAGPAFNLILPVVIFTAVYLVGAREPGAWIGGVQPDSPLAAAGAQPGDAITAVNGTPVRLLTELAKQLQESQGPIKLSVVRAGQPLELNLEPGDVPRDDLAALGLSIYAARPTLTVLPDSPAQRAGLTSSDRILAVDGLAVEWWAQVLPLLDGAPRRLTVRSEEADQTRDVTLSPAPLAVSMADGVSPLAPFLAADGGLDLAALQAAHPGLAYGLAPSELTIEDVVAGKPAASAGILEGDVVLAAEGLSFGGWAEFSRFISTGEGSPVALIVLRGRELRVARTQPELQTLPTGKVARIGVQSAAEMGMREETVRLSLLPALERGVKDTGLVIATMGVILKQLVVGEVALSESIGGPISIVKEAQRSAGESLLHFVRMIALISISLGVTNLLPIPLLDGGHLLFFSVEAVRGRPVSLRFRELSHQVGLLIIFALFAYAIINDTRNYFLK